MLGLLAATVTMAGCGISNLSFVVNNRIHFTAPKPRALVHLPVTISWRADPPLTSGSYAVFVDRAPIKPGQTLAAVADATCRRTPGCLTVAYLANRSVFQTTAPTLTLATVHVDSTTKATIQTHEATVVILDAQGRRVGESAWYIDFRTRKGQP
jgi:hypothetical protein